jgi:DNA repair protein RecO (recombination protein O)
LFRFLEQAILQLEEKIFSALFHLKFLIDLTRYIGFYPNISNLENPCFDMENGCFCFQTDSKKIITGKELEAFKTLLGTNFDNIMNVSITSVIKIKLLDLIVDYYSLHLQRFSKIKSLPILHEVFRET